MPKRSQPKSRSVQRAATARKAARPRDFEQAITAIVQSRISPKTPARLKRVMNSLIKHLHDFVRDVELTEAEWWTAIDFLTRTGQMCDDKRQEFILLSDTTGVTMLTDAINHRKAGNATESTIFGPFYRGGAPELPFGSSIQSAAGGEPAVLTGRVLDTRGKPIANATLDVWETDDDGMYDSQVGDGSQLNLRGVFRTNARGEYKIVAIKPVPYPIPSDGPVGQMLKALGRHPYRPAHIHVIAAAAGYEAVTTHIFASDSKYLDGDAVFGVKDSLIADFVVNRSASAAAGHGVSAPFYDVQFDFVLQKAKKKAAKRRFTT